MIISKDNQGNWTPVATGNGTFVGTKAAFDAVKDDLPDNTVAYTTDDGTDFSPRSTTKITFSGKVILPNAGLTYTASADGLVIVHAYKKRGGNTLFLSVNGNVVDEMTFNVPTMLEDCYGCQIRLTGYVRKGDTFKISSDGNTALYCIQNINLQTISWYK
jgi:hypothetical protein